MRFPSDEEKEWMNEMLQKYIREKFDVVYWTNKPYDFSKLPKKLQKDKKFMRDAKLANEDRFYYDDVASFYYVNAYLANVSYPGGEKSTHEKPAGVNIKIRKKLFNEWLKKNGIEKPKFPRGKRLKR